MDHIIDQLRHDLLLARHYANLTHSLNEQEYESNHSELALLDELQKSSELAIERLGEATDGWHIGEKVE